MGDFDFTPMLRSMIGFDRMLDVLESARDTAPASNYPPYNIEKTGEDSWRIEIAVAGFSPDELSVVQERNELLVTGAKKGDQPGQFLYRGIATRSFDRRFELADYVEVKSAGLVDGLLTIELVREVPEEKRPRRIAIGAGAPISEPARLGKKAA